MPRSLLTAFIIVADDSGDLVVVKNALVRIYEQGTTTPATGVYVDKIGGSPIASVLSDSHGVVTLWFDDGRVVDLNVTDNADTALRVGTTSTPINFDEYTLVADAGSGGGGGGTSFLNGSPTPFHPDTIGAVTWAPDLSLAPKFKVTTTGNPTIHMPVISGIDPNMTYDFLLDLIMDGTGGYGDPVWDTKVTWIGNKSTRSQGPGDSDEYLFRTDGTNSAWRGYHLSATDTEAGVAASSIAVPPAGSLTRFVDSADGVAKFKDEHNQLHVAMIHVGTTAPTNTAIPWLDIT